MRLKFSDCLKPDWCNLLWENFESETEQFDSFDKRSEIKLKCSGIKTCQYYRWYVWFYTLTLHLEEILLVLVSTTTLITYYICPSSQSPPSTSWRPSTWIPWPPPHVRLCWSVQSNIWGLKAQEVFSALIIMAIIEFYMCIYNICVFTCTYLHVHRYKW